MKKPVTAHIAVSDHAVARYLERVLGFDIDGVRRVIADDCRAAIALGARTLRKDGFQYHFQDGTVATITKDQPGISATSKRLAWKRPPKVAR